MRKDRAGWERSFKDEMFRNRLWWHVRRKIRPRICDVLHLFAETEALQPIISECTNYMTGKFVVN
jgi:phage gp46-like protein